MTVHVFDNSVTKLIPLFRFSIFSECWSEKPEDRPTFQWICAAVKRLVEDQKVKRNQLLCRKNILENEQRISRFPSKSIANLIARLQNNLTSDQRGEVITRK